MQLATYKNPEGTTIVTLHYPNVIGTPTGSSSLHVTPCIVYHAHFS